MSFLSKNFKPLLILVVAVFLLFLPSLVGWRGIFQDDQAMAEFPWHFFLARHFQTGEIPLWEPDTWCGAIPFYARYYADTYYFPLWPFYLLAQPNDLDQAYLFLSLIPLLFHYALAAVGMFVFCRRGMNLSAGASLLAAWVYVFSPAFSYSYVWFPIVAVQAWLPWLLLLVVYLDRKFSWSRVVWVGVVIAFMSLAAQPPHLGYALLLAFLLAVSLGIRRGLKRQRWRSFQALGGLLVAVTLSVLLAAVYWFSMVDGMGKTEQHIGESYQDMTGFDGSLPPLYLATMFAPELFNTVTGGREIWGGDISYQARYWEANLQGGIVVMFLALGGLIGCFYSRRRFWSIFSGLLLIFSLLCVLGRHTPFYYWFYRLIPGITRFPFPIRYRLLECIALAWLCGLGLDGLRARAGFCSPRRVWGYLTAVLLIVGLAVLWPQDFSAVSERWGLLYPRDDPWTFPGIMEVFCSGNLKWFLFRVFPSLFGGMLIVFLMGRALTGRLRTVVAIGVVMFETFCLSATAFYFGTFARQFPLPQHHRAVRPSDHPMVNLVKHNISPLFASSNLRWATDQPFLENYARLTRTRAFLGYDMKPLETKYKRALEEAYEQPVDWPIYWSSFLPRNPGLFSSMAVAAVFTSQSEPIFSGGEVTRLSFSPELYLHQNPSTLPPAYFQDRIILASMDTQRQKLLDGQLAEAAYICGGAAQMLARGIPVRNRESLAALVKKERSGPQERFLQLQKINRVDSLNLKSANQVSAWVTVNRPAMLVVAEVWYPGWKAFIDGKKVPLYRVNYIQRGVWVPIGHHLVEMSFSPPAWRLGAILSILLWILTIMFLLWSRWREQRN